MPDNLFRDVVDPSITVGAKKRYFVPFSIAVHVLVVIAALILPIVASDALPMPPEMLAFLSAAPAPLPPPPPPRAIQSRHPVAEMDPAVAPITAPADIRPEDPVEPVRDAPGNPAGLVEGVPSSIVESAVPPPPPPAPAPPAEPVRAIRSIKPPMKLKDVAPKYPTVALTARVEGIVIIEATIGISGRVEDARILRSVPLLDAAALDAVRQWEYSPTLLNGVPVPVLVTVTVAFALH